MNIKSMSDTYTLNNGAKIPVMGFGTWQTPDGDVAKQVVQDAIASGYRLIDTAAGYQNEDSIGDGIKASGINRQDLFITTKLWNTDHGYQKTKDAIDRSLKNLGIDYLDMYLIHWPNPKDFRDRWEEANNESWQAMEEAVKAGKIKTLGVSNFRRRHMDALLKEATIIPAVNQIYLNPSDMQPEVTKMDAEHNILNEAYSPLGTGGLLKNTKIDEIAKEYGKTPAQVLLRWSLQHGFLPLAKSVHAKYIQSNTEIFDFELSNQAMSELDKLHGTGNLAMDPDTAEF